MHRVVVTGIGIVAPLGIGVEPFWANLRAGAVATRRVTRFPVDAMPAQVAAEVDGFDPHAFLEPRRIARTDRFAQFALAATHLALDDAQLLITGDGTDAGTYIGSALGGLAFAEEQHDAFRTQGLGVVRPLLAISVFGGAAISNVALEFGLRGPNVANGNSCASGAVAIGDAYRAIARGDVRYAVAGGCEAPLAPLVFGAFAVIRAMSTRNAEPARASRPFDRARDGFVMAEGAAMLVLERETDAIARGAQIYAEIVGYGLTNDAHHMSAPDPDGRYTAAAIAAALGEAHRSPDEIELVNAHGSGTDLGDRAEALALRRAFGAHRVPIVATKGQHGHALGATGAWEAAVTLLAMRDGVVPRIVNCDDPEDGDLDFVRAERALRPRLAVSVSAGFGGINAALVFATLG